MSSIALLEDLAPEMADVADATKTTFLSLAASMHTASQWAPATYPSAMCYFAAHLLTLAEAASSSPSAYSAASATAGGPVSGKREGPRSVSYATPTNLAQTVEEAALMETKYGRMYLALRKRQAAAHCFLARPS